MRPVPPPGPVGILLAAGASTRFGAADKLLHPLADGRPMALAAAESLLAGVDAALAVVRPGADHLAGLLRRLGLEVVECADAEQGMGRSLACGVARRSTAPGWLIALSDMPCVQPATVRAVAEALTRGAALAAPVYHGRRGHPVGFDARFREALTRLDGDRGARALIGEHRALLTAIPTRDAGCLRDIDHFDDL